MKIVSVVAKVLAALAAAVGTIYLLATYGEQIVAWCKKVMNSLPSCQCCSEAEPVAEEAPAAPAAPVAPVAEDEDEVLEEVPVEEIPVVDPAANEVVADENDFAE